LRAVGRSQVETVAQIDDGVDNAWFGGGPSATRRFRREFQAA
jgi:hypothetical protein